MGHRVYFHIGRVTCCIENTGQKKVAIVWLPCQNKKNGNKRISLVDSEVIKCFQLFVNKKIP